MLRNNEYYFVHIWAVRCPAAQRTPLSGGNTPETKQVAARQKNVRQRNNEYVWGGGGCVSVTEIRVCVFVYFGLPFSNFENIHTARCRRREDQYKSMKIKHILLLLSSLERFTLQIVSGFITSWGRFRFLYIYPIYVTCKLLEMPGIQTLLFQPDISKAEKISQLNN